MSIQNPLYIEYGTQRIPFYLQFDLKKTLRITVNVDRKVIVVAPLFTEMEIILKKLIKRGPWISRQIRKFETSQKVIRNNHKEYVSGETFYFLGRKYRLKILIAGRASVRIHGRYLQVMVERKDALEKITSLISNWYKRQAREIFEKFIEKYKFILTRENISLNKLIVRSLRKRWGSCTQQNNIVINSFLVQAPVQCIEYIIVHELCHLKYLDHSREFYFLLDKYMDDWQKRKQQLEETDISIIK